MAASKDDIQRATVIMQSIMNDLAEPPLDLKEEDCDSLTAVQSVLDILKSPLFAAVVDIRDQCRKSVRDSERWNEVADVRVTHTADVVTQFKERYKIAGSQDSVDVRQSSTAICTSSTLSDNLMDDTSITPPSESPQHIGLPLHCSSDEYGSALNREHQRTPSTSSNGSCSSAGSKKTKGRRRGTCGKGLTLGQLARDPTQPGEIPLKTLPGQFPQDRKSSTVSLSSQSEASPPPLPPSLPPDLFPTAPSWSPTTTGISDDKGEGSGSGNHPKDLLFFMRDKESMTDVRATLNGNWGRGQRKVSLSHDSSQASIGLELCGLSSTGVFIAAVTEPSLEDRLQIGDQILEVDGHTIDMMAWFEVQQILQSGSENKQSTGMVEEEELFKEQCHVLIVQFNPAGLGEVKRIESKPTS